MRRREDACFCLSRYQSPLFQPSRRGRGGGHPAAQVPGTLNGLLRSFLAQERVVVHGAGARRHGLVLIAVCFARSRLLGGGDTGRRRMCRLTRGGAAGWATLSSLMRRMHPMYLAVALGDAASTAPPPMTFERRPAARRRRTIPALHHRTADAACARHEVYYLMRVSARSLPQPVRQAVLGSTR